MVDRYGPLRRTICFAVAVIVLLFLARAGVPTPVTQLAFVVFIAMATLWVRGQYVDSLDDHRQWTVPAPAGLALAAVAAVCLALFAFTHRGGLGVVGALAFYLAAGAGVSAARQHEELRVGRLRVRPLPWASRIAVAGAVLLVLGVLALRFVGQPLVGALLILAAVLVLLPPGLAVLAERAIRALCERPRPWIGPTGAAVFVAAATVAYLLAGSWWVPAALVVLGLSVVALVSSTQAEIAIVLAVVALMGITPPHEDVPPELRPGTADPAVIAMGDSYLSGEGASTYFDGTDEGGRNTCHRSPTSWVARAAVELDWRLAFLACSGARTENIMPSGTPSDVYPDPEPQPGEDGTQLDQAARFTAPRMVVLSVGGNDSGFVTISLMCIAPGTCTDKERLWTDALAQLGARLDVMYRAVNAAFPDTPVVVVPYPEPIADNPRCDQVALNPSERAFIRRFATSLNDTVRAAADRAGFFFAEPMRHALRDAHLQLCDPDNRNRPGLNFLALRSVSGIAEQRFNPANWLNNSLHPNERGHAALLRAFRTWYAAQPMPARSGAGAAQATRAEPRDVTPCGLFALTGDGCRAQGQRWAVRQVGQMLLQYGVLGVLTAGGAFAGAVGLFAWRRRHRVGAREKVAYRENGPAPR
ncbi:hypothetical protein Val02_12630 [Virgisporangium aliadipatigenens]|uniref:SGNH hydrolase-type esterase domain-containing protein n=2 Tax=Virgisporangium aliadipatigenens TaxID=741659 RepID=A0A8J3YHI4_9ACTN|nr:hypothetical protein Val02_12630 [Virgisporangium aliadipatigenens]